MKNRPDEETIERITRGIHVYQTMLYDCGSEELIVNSVNLNGTNGTWVDDLKREEEPKVVPLKDVKEAITKTWREAKKQNLNSIKTVVRIICNEAKDKIINSIDILAEDDIEKLREWEREEGE